MPTVSDWNPDLYLRFEDERTRPARDLLAQVEPSPTVRRIVDLGCGPGNSTALLADRFHQAVVTGVDNSAAMLASAAARLPSCRFEQANIATWTPDEAPDILYANASLQWVADHHLVLPRLFGTLKPGGVLAVQMPDNRDEPSHHLMREVASLPAFARWIDPAASQRVAVLPLNSYYDLLAPLAERMDLWRTTYHHPMGSAGDIVVWLRSTGLRPFLDGLPETEWAAFLQAYETRLEQAYAERSNGRRLLAFPRLFFVARRPVSASLS